MKYAQITGWGMHVPNHVLTNEHFVEMGLDTSDEWIASRTGIERRHVVKDETTSELSIKAARKALLVAEMHPKDLDLVIVATCTPDHIMPATASLVQDRLGAVNAGAMDLNAACAGFVYALTTGASYIEARRAKNILVIGADELSMYLNWRDRSTCVLFGDGAGAVVLSTSDEPGIMSSEMGSDGSGAGLLTIPGARPRSRVNGHANGHVTSSDFYLRMNGPQIFRWATQMMAKAADNVMSSSGLNASQIDLFIPHQANQRIMAATAKRLGLPMDKVFSNVKDYGNTSAASIPIALCDAISSGRVKPGDHIVLSSFGAGLSWSALAMRWGVAIPSQVSRWSPIRREVDRQVAAVRSRLRREQWRVRSQIDKRLRKENGE